LLAADGTADVVVVNPASRRRTGTLPELPTEPKAAPRDEASAAKGAELYSRHCASCHGTERRGDGPGAVGLMPAPTALEDRWFTRERLLEALWHGVPGTAMPAWRDLPLADLNLLVFYIQYPESYFRADRVSEAPAPDATERGARVYAANCAQCHGAAGAGDGPAANSLPRPPTNFRRQKMGFFGVIATLEQGIPGTMMAPWGSRLSREDMAAVAHHIRTYFGEDDRARSNR
jgi:mono/diheme cytochrome c family protein